MARKSSDSFSANRSDLIAAKSLPVDIHLPMSGRIFQQVPRCKTERENTVSAGIEL